LTAPALIRKARRHLAGRSNDASLGRMSAVLHRPFDSGIIMAGEAGWRVGWRGTRFVGI